MTLNSFIDDLYPPSLSVDFDSIVSLYERSIKELPEDEVPIASSAVIRLLARENWLRCLNMAPLALMNARSSQEDWVAIVENLVLFMPPEQDMPAFLAKELESLRGDNLHELAQSASFCYRAKCLRLLIMARSAASATDLHEALMELEREAQLVNPINELIVSAISALSNRVDVLEPFNPFLKRLIALSKAEGVVKPIKTANLVKVFEQWDTTMYTGPIEHRGEMT